MIFEFLGIAGLNMLYGLLGVVILAVAFKLFNRATPNLNFVEMLNDPGTSRGIAILIAAVLLGVAFIIGSALN